MSSFRSELESLINHYNLDTMYNTPDFILAGLVIGFLQNWGLGLEEVRRWHQWPTLAESHAAMFNSTTSPTEGDTNVG